MHLSLQLGLLLAVAAGDTLAKKSSAGPVLERDACPDYTTYAATKHAPYSSGPLKLPSQRPDPACRTFKSNAVEQVIKDITSRMIDKDLAKLFENAFPNTLDTTIRWHDDGNVNGTRKGGEAWQGPQSFVVTGDINAEWLRDSANQLSCYQSLSSKDPALKTLLHGAINTQVEYVLQSPYCNAFQPPPPSGIGGTSNGQRDHVTPAYEPSVVFECKYEVDSLASFLALGTDLHESTGTTEFMSKRWYYALEKVLNLIDEQEKSTFDKNGQYQQNVYTFQRQTTAGTETLNLKGIGNPLRNGTGLVRSAFRPSDDATIFGYFIPGNAMLSVQLAKTAKLIEAASGPADKVKNLLQRSEAIRNGIFQHGVFDHAKFGRVFAFEVDGYGSSLFMDDANIPSLLALPVLGFVDTDDPIYKNTRKMILSQEGNPYYLQGSAFHGIGGPHIGLVNAWPMSALVRAMTTNDDHEIMSNIDMVRDVSLLGLVHESINVNQASKYTRPWFAWANSVFSQAIFNIAERKPDLIFGKGAAPYKVGHE